MDDELAPPELRLAGDLALDDLARVALPALGVEPPLELEFVRELTQADLDLVRARAPALSVGERLSALHHRHHLAARLIADGAKTSEVAYACGYSAGTISGFRSDPAFQDLVAHYASRKEAVYLDVHQRLGSLGMSVVDELQARLDDPEQRARMTTKQLSEIAALALDRSIAPARGAQASAPAASGPGLVVNLSFAEPKQAPTLDLTPAPAEPANAT